MNDNREKIKIHTVSEINATIATIFETNHSFNNIYIQGEVGNFSHSKSGHVYFNLKDKNAIIAVNVWKFTLAKLEPELLKNLKEGTKVIVRGKLSVYEKGGTYNLIANEIKFFGEGELALQFLKIKEELFKLGLFDPIHKKPIKRFNYDIAVITSRTGAVIRDIISTIKRRFPNVNLRTYNSVMQGKDAEQDIINNLKAADKNNHDVIIIARGGGSLEDLWVFNSKLIALEVFNANTPIISAIGHETDTTIIDYVSDMKAPTPTAAAELINPHIDDVKKEVRRLSELLFKDVNNLIVKTKYELMLFDKSLLRIPNSINKIKERLIRVEKKFLYISNIFVKNSRVKVNTYERQLQTSILTQLNLQKNKIVNADYIIDKNFVAIIEENKLKLNKYNWDLSQVVRKKLDQEKHQLLLYNQHLNLLNPEEIFKKGFFYLKQEQQLIKNLAEVKKDQTLIIYSEEVNVETRVLNINHQKKK